jgi:hypothetical protein
MDPVEPRGVSIVSRGSEDHVVIDDVITRSRYSLDAGQALSLVAGAEDDDGDIWRPPALNVLPADLVIPLSQVDLEEVAARAARTIEAGKAVTLQVPETTFHLSQAADLVHLARTTPGHLTIEMVDG